MSYTFVPADLVFHSKLMPWLALAYATVFATFYAYNAYSWAVGRTNPTTVTIYITLQPLFTAILSVIFLSDDVTAAEGVGGLLIAIGLVVTAYGASSARFWKEFCPYAAHDFLVAANCQQQFPGNQLAGEAIGDPSKQAVSDVAYAAITDDDDSSTSP